MRLIDADALASAIQFERDFLIARGQYGAEHVLVHHFERILEDVPTVDAIPVEWLEAQIMPYNGDAGDVGFTVYNVTIKNLIRKWHAEQEASEDGDRTTD